MGNMSVTRPDAGAVECGNPSHVRKSRPKLQIMNPLQTKSSQDFAFALMKMMNDFDCKYSKVNDELDDNVPLIVVCPKVSRIQPDVDLAIQSVRRSTHYFVIYLHFGSERNLPAVPSKQKLRNYMNVTLIDMGFNDQGAIYECQQNTLAERQLRLYVDTYQPENSASGSSGYREPIHTTSNPYQSSSRAISQPTPPPKLRSEKPGPRVVKLSEELLESENKDITALKPKKDSCQNKGSSTSLELSSSTRNPDPSSPVRHSEQQKLLSDQPWRQLSKRGDELVESVIKDIKALKLENDPLFRLLRHVGTRKSSFINSCISVGACRKKVLAITGRAASSYSLEDDEVLKNFRLTDSMVFEPVFDFHTDDIVYLLEGHVKKKYKFDPEKPMTVESKFYRKKPNFEHKTHCVVFVLDARTMHCDIPDVYIEKIKDLQEQIQRADVPRVLILTHVDMLCDEVKKDASKIFRSLKVEEAMKKASAVFCIEMASIHPVINYEEDFELNKAKNILILLALRQIMHYACDRAEQVLNESESESSEENDSD